MKKTTKNDLILIFSILIISLIALLIFNSVSKKDNLIAEVYYKDELVLEIDLSKLSDEITYYNVDGELGNIKIAAKKNSIAVVEEISPYHLCSLQGFISNSHESLICLPNKVYIKLIGKTNSNIDVEM